MDRSMSLLSGGEEKRQGGGRGKEKKGGPFPSFCTSLQEVLNWFSRLCFEFVFQIWGPCECGCESTFFKQFSWIRPGLYQVSLTSFPLPPSPSSPFATLSLSLKRRKEVTFTLLKKACVSRQDARADNIDPWLPLKNLLCLTDFSSFGLNMQLNESQVPVKMSPWAGSLPVQNWPLACLHTRVFFH